MFRSHPHATTPPQFFRHTRSHSLVGACLALLHLGASSSSAQSGTRADEQLVGWWGAEPVLGPVVSGPMSLEQQGSRWRLQVGGFEASAEQRGDSVTIRLPGEQGALRVWQQGRALQAFWVQPGGWNQPFAIPVRLRAVASHQWTGRVEVVSERFPLYLGITRAPSGDLRATFRNPSMNWGGRFAHLEVVRDGSTLQFRVPTSGAVQYTQPYDSVSKRITFDFGVPVVLAPRTIEQVPGFVTRSPSLPPYRYRVPLVLEDGWTSARAGAVGVSESALERVVRDLVAADPFDNTVPRVHSLVVARHGRLILDEYFRGSDATELHDLRSASKTMTSILAGAAMLRGAKYEGHVLGADTPVGSAGVTLGHLLSHSSGKACNDDDDASPGNEDRMQSQSVQPDWYAFFMALPRDTTPGRVYSYCSAGINMAGGVVGRASGQWIPRFFDTNIAIPLQLGTYAINLMPTGEAYSGGGMRMTSRDLLKFGQLYLNDGVWRGQRLIPSAWIRASTARVMQRADSSTDGYGWHRHTLLVNGRPVETYSAGGNGGQIMLVAPALDMTVAVTAGSYGQYAVWQRILKELIPSVLAAARR